LVRRNERGRNVLRLGAVVYYGRTAHDNHNSRYSGNGYDGDAERDGKPERRIDDMLVQILNNKSRNK
jgi:hypothetical protein